MVMSRMFEEEASADRLRQELAERERRRQAGLAEAEEAEALLHIKLLEQTDAKLDHLNANLEHFRAELSQLKQSLQQPAAPAALPLQPKRRSTRLVAAATVALLAAAAGLAYRDWRSPALQGVSQPRETAPPAPVLSEVPVVPAEEQAIFPPDPFPDQQIGQEEPAPAPEAAVKAQPEEAQREPLAAVAQDREAAAPATTHLLTPPPLFPAALEAVPPLTLTPVEGAGEWSTADGSLFPAQPDAEREGSETKQELPLILPDGSIRI